ncbi:MAG TPA: RNA 2',3'-cyclic phosphodiesterase [Planctomycetaceae bacterium]
MDERDDGPAGTIRAFAAVTIRTTPPLLTLLSKLGGMGKAVRAVRADQLHVTLKFFGDVDESLIPSMTAGLDRVAADGEPFGWSLRGTGAFPSPARPSVVWAGVEDAGRFAALAEGVERFSEALGFAREPKAFHPHVTLARVKFRPPPSLGDLLRETAGEEFGPQRAEGIVLYRSDLGPGGSAYTVLHVARLGGT